MTAFSNSAVIVCVCTIACSIIGVVAPASRMKKIVNLTLGVFMLCSMLVPVIGLVSAMSYDIDTKDIALKENIDYDGEFEELVLTKTADNLVLAVNDLLLTEEIVADDIIVRIKKSDNNSIYISSISIYISKEYESQVTDIVNVIGRNMYKEPVVIVSES